MVTTSDMLAQAVAAAVDNQLEGLSRKDIAAKSLATFGARS
jgi:histidinol dehydrogenase